MRQTAFEASLLTDRLPDTVPVGGRDYPLLTDFRRWILIAELFGASASDGSPVWNDFSRAMLAMRIVCPTLREAMRDVHPAKRETLAAEFLDGIGAFALCGKPLPKSGETASASGGLSPSPAFDFEADGERIVASFQAVYGMDLTTCTLHWWHFLALLRHLPPDSPFMQAVALRTADLSQIRDEGLRKRVRRARAAVRIRK